MRIALILCLALVGCKQTPQTVKFVNAPDGDVAKIVTEQMAKSKTEGRRVLVYVSAPWCEPCRVFHEAVDRGEMTGKLGPLDLISFNGDVDAERLIIADYEQRFIPAFTVPDENGKASKQHMEGSVKGDGAKTELVPRLRELLKLPAM